jgi:exopolysaccharide biosynthesis polyprenyl glycosylphosphotransferase
MIEFAETEQDRLRARLLERYADPRLLGSLQHGRLVFKRMLWLGVLRGTYALKRALDIVVSGAGLLLLAPVFLGVAAAIRLESPGSVLFRQTRVGRWGQLFSMYKFRSMYVDAEARKQALLAANEMRGGVIFKMKEDPRITRVGRLIRRASLDELPQLWNVFIGDMSLVGPRPPVPAEVDQYSLADRRRLEVIPGITCIWQISGRSDIPFEEQVQLDVQYIESQSLFADLRILLWTIPAVLLGKGAY